MNETETPLTVGDTEGTGDRKKKKVPVKKPGKSTPRAAKSGTTGKGARPATKSKKKAAKPTTKPKSGGSKPTKKKGGAAKKSAPSAPRTGGGKKPGKSGKGAASGSTGTTSVDTSKLTAHGDYGIARIDQPDKSNHGWYVRMGTGAGKILKFFGDKKYGGKAKAKTAAIKFRNDSYAGLPDKLKLIGSKPMKKRARKAA